ncbi:MAG: metalloregulator ArsR/SmtB family transcription factor [Verrucomicrobia bacterium]|nr:metalloregulator ArsR/SmtB family transcription factor [Verrucomicrobiota bacterium]
MAQTLDIFKALSDEIRLRIVRAIGMAELSVAELVQVLGLPQSTVSRHLKPLRDVGLVQARRDGTSVFYHRGTAFDDPVLSKLLDERLSDVSAFAEDGASITRVLDFRKNRSKEFFDQIAGSYESLTDPGGGWQVLATALAAGFKGKVVADLGAGEGALALILASYAEKVITVDQSARMLDLVRTKADGAGVLNRIELLEGEVESLPVGDATVDAAFLSQVLHHAAQPVVAVAEAARILKKGGLLIILDLLSHEQEWVREQWADQWLGFEETEIEEWMKRNGVEPVSIKKLTGSTPELAVLIAVGEKS